MKERKLYRLAKVIYFLKGNIIKPCWLAKEIMSTAVSFKIYTGRRARK